METTRNVKGALSFLAVSMIIVVYDVAGTYTHPKWGEKTPAALMHIMPFLMNVIVPSVFVLAGFAAAYALMGDRRGYLGIMAIGVLALVWDAFPAVWRLQAGAPEGASICIFEMLVGIIMIRYAFLALREQREAGARVAANVPSGV
ncbi:MAG TPA: hypothetical protein VE776_00725 [Actinomycetota bacterium]|jgi:hypothetical protein|nr:hypothetical protein [Actinomycetota bacterium]